VATTLLVEQLAGHKLTFQNNASYFTLLSPGEYMYFSRIRLHHQVQIRAYISLYIWLSFQLMCKFWYVMTHTRTCTELFHSHKWLWSYDGLKISKKMQDMIAFCKFGHIIFYAARESNCNKITCLVMLSLVPRP